MIKRRAAKAVAAISLAACLALTGCHGYVDDLVNPNGTSSNSETDDNSSKTESGYIKGDISTENILEDLKILGRLAMPSDFRVTMRDNDSEMGSTRVTMDMHLGQSVSIASFTDFDIEMKGLKISMPDFDMLSANGSIYLSESAMSRSMTLYAQMAMLSAIASGNLKDDELAETIERSKEIDEAMDGLLEASENGEYIKLSGAEASAVPIILMTPVSSTMVAGYFGNDISDIAKLFEDDIDMFCRTDDSGYHILEVDSSNAKAFYERLLSLEDSQILGLVMMDTYDDGLWSSITSETYMFYADTIQAYIDSYKDHWKKLIDAVENDGFEYSYKLSMRIRSDKDIHIKLEMHTMESGVETDRMISVDTIDAKDGIELPNGKLIKTPEQWEADMEPLLDEYLGKFRDEIDEAKPGDSDGDNNSPEAEEATSE